MELHTRVILCLAALTAGCASYEYANQVTWVSKPFEVAIQPKEVKLTWEVVDNADETCRAEDARMRENPLHILGCAFWSKKDPTVCRIITGKLTTHEALGHELRHCFEGKFHK